MDITEAYKEGYIKGCLSAQEENASLRAEIKAMQEMINRLRETIARTQEEYFE